LIPRGLKARFTPLVALTTATEIHRLTPTLAWWSAYEPAVKCDLTSHALHTPEGLVLIDPIALAHPKDLGGPPIAILLTNANHARAAHWWREQTGARILAPADALPDLEITPDATLEDGALTPGGLRAIRLPGGPPGETAYLSDGLCCLGDALIHLESHGFALLPDKYCADAVLLRTSLRKLLSYHLHILTFAHGAPLVDHVRERLASLLS
jgi:hypothetical protein